MFERVLALAGSTEIPNDEIGSLKNILLEPGASPYRAVTVQPDRPAEGGCDWMRLDRYPNRGVHHVGILRPRLIGHAEIVTTGQYGITQAAARLNAQDQSRLFSRDVEAQLNRRSNLTHLGANGVKRQKFGPLE